MSVFFVMMVIGEVKADMTDDEQSNRDVTKELYTRIIPFIYQCEV